MRDIVRIGRAHLATEGAAALSLRAVARDLGVVSSAVYRYVGSRDELLTLLVVDGYDELGDAVDAALERVDRTDHVGRLVAIARATRTWALAEPARPSRRPDRAPAWSGGSSRCGRGPGRPGRSRATRRR
jgi:AcrR family transcriptional regulator